MAPENLEFWNWATFLKNLDVFNRFRKIWSPVFGSNCLTDTASVRWTSIYFVKFSKFKVFTETFQAQIAYNDNRWLICARIYFFSFFWKIQNLVSEPKFSVKKKMTNVIDKNNLRTLFQHWFRWFQHFQFEKSFFWVPSVSYCFFLWFRQFQSFLEPFFKKAVSAVLGLRWFLVGSIHGIFLG